MPSDRHASGTPNRHDRPTAGFQFAEGDRGQDKIAGLAVVETPIQVRIAAENGVDADIRVEHVFHVASTGSVERIGLRATPVPGLRRRLVATEVLEVRPELAERGTEAREPSPRGANNQLVALPLNLDFHVDAVKGECAGYPDRLAVAVAEQAGRLGSAAGSRRLWIDNGHLRTSAG